MLFTLLVLAILEVSLSFDNAIVNAKLLKRLPQSMQKIFLTIGWLIAVVWVRFKLPAFIVALSLGLKSSEIEHMALFQPELYASTLQYAKGTIDAFGGSFLLCLFCSFLFSDEKELHWLPCIEHPAMNLAKETSSLGCLAIYASIILLLGSVSGLPLLPGVIGVVLFTAMKILEEGLEMNSGGIKKVLWGFLFLEIIDASFSLDGVIAAFSITNNIYQIAIGLGIGAWAIRYLTVKLVQRNTLQSLPYLEHGAYWSIGVLGFLTLFSKYIEIPQYALGAITLAIILLSYRASLKLANNLI